MEVTTGKYFDGKSSKPYNVKIKVNGSSIQISMLDDKFQSIYWNLDKIKINSYTSTKKISLQYGEFPHQILEFETEDIALINAIKQQQGSINKIEYSITQSNPYKLVFGSIITLALLLFSYVKYIGPAIGTQAVKLIPIEIEKKTGESIYNNMDILSITNREEGSELLQDFYNSLNYKSKYDIRITYSDSDIVNAFAIPGGRIVVYRGLIDKMDSWEELAALMAHELAHINQRHSFKAIAQSISSYLFISVLTGDVAGTSAIILENASKINEMSNSRINEKEADVIGFEYLIKSKINPKGMRTLFENLHLEEGGHIPEEGAEDNNISRIDRGLEFISTHPLTEKRIKYISERIDMNRNRIYSENKTAKEIFKKIKGLRKIETKKKPIKLDDDLYDEL